MPAPYMTPQRNNQNAGLLGLLDTLKQHNATVAARPAGRPRPIANQAWMQAQGFDPMAGLGGVGGQYVPNYENRLGVASPNAMMDPRQQGGGPAPRADTRGLRQGFTTMIGTPTPGGLSPEVAAGRQALAANRREAGLAPRMAAVQERGRVNAEARRMRMGNLTYDERLQAGVPGLAVERERAGGLRDVANIQAGVSRDAIAAQERVAQAANEVQLALKRGDWKAAAKAQRAQITADRELKSMESTTAMGVAGLQTEAGLKRVESEDKYRQEELGLRKEERGIQMAEQYRQAANAAAASGDWDGYRRNNQLADQMMSRAAPGLPANQPTAGQPGSQAGLPAASQSPQSWGQMPLPMRQQLAGGSAEEMVNNLRQTFPDMPQDQMDEMIQAAYPGTTVTMYNPDGYGMSDFIGGITGFEGFNRLARGVSGRGPKPPRNAVMPGLPGVVQTYLGY